MPLYQFKKDSMERTLLFIHVPKTGGTAIEDYFRSLGLSCFYDPISYRAIRPLLKIPPAHYDYNMYDQIFRLDRMYSFAIVRNPIHRMISEYRWAVQKSNLPDNVKRYSFSDFLKFAFEGYGKDQNFLAGHLKPQNRFIGSKLSKSFKYESGLNSIVAEVFRDNGLKPQRGIHIPVSNRSGNQPVHLNDADVEAIHRVYSEDFELFGYSRDIPKHDAGQQVIG